MRLCLFACSATLAASLSVQSDRGATLKLLVPQDTVVAPQPFTDSSQLPFKPADPSTCTSVLDASNDAWCVSTCATACPPQQCKCTGDQAPLVGTTGDAAKEIADTAAAARTDAVSKSLEAAEAAKRAIAEASAAKISSSENPAENPATPQDSFKPADPRTCKSVAGGTTDDWCISTCATACLPQLCECEGGQEPALAPDPQAAPNPVPIAPAVGSKEYLCQNHGQCDQPIVPAATVPAGVADPTDPAAGTASIPVATIPAGNSITDATEDAPAPADPAAEAAAMATANAAAHASFKPTDASTCYSIIESTDDKWCISTCEEACPPATCACDSDSGPVVAVAATPLPAVEAPALPTWADGAGAASFVPQDATSCLSVAPSTTDSWCQSTCETSCPPQMCVCDAAAKNATAIKAEAAASVGTPEIAPHYANGSPKPPKYVGDTRNFNGGNMDCISLNPATADAWCQLNCVDTPGEPHPEVRCPEDLCQCDKDGVKQRAQEHDSEVANWKEAEARVRGADIGTSYPDGLPPAPEAENPTAGWSEERSAGVPDDPHTCKAIAHPATDLWCQRVCEDAVCPGKQCKCDGMKADDYSDSKENSNFAEDPSNLRADDPNHPMADPTLPQ